MQFRITDSLDVLSNEVCGFVTRQFVPHRLA